MRAMSQRRLTKEDKLKITQHVNENSKKVDLLSSQKSLGNKTDRVSSLHKTLESVELLKSSRADPSTVKINAKEEFESIKS